MRLRRGISVSVRVFHIPVARPPGCPSEGMVLCLRWLLKEEDAMATVASPTVYEAPGRPGSPVELKPRYENFIGGEWVRPRAASTTRT